MTTEIQTRQSPADPWSDLDEFVDDLRQQFFDAWGVRPFGPATSTNASGPVLRPARTDIVDTGKAYKIVADFPGVPKENLDIRVRGSSVEIRGEHATATKSDDESVLHRERTFAGYYRAFELPEAVVASEAKAKVDNGVLELELPKEKPTPSPAEVKVSVQ